MTLNEYKEFILSLGFKERTKDKFIKEYQNVVGTEGNESTSLKVEHVIKNGSVSVYYITHNKLRKKYYKGDLKNLSLSNGNLKGLCRVYDIKNKINK